MAVGYLYAHITTAPLYIDLISFVLYHVDVTWMKKNHLLALTNTYTSYIYTHMCVYVHTHMIDKGRRERDVNVTCERIWTERGHVDSDTLNRLTFNFLLEIHLQSPYPDFFIIIYIIV